MAREKPATERTRDDERLLSMGVGFIGSNFSYHDFDTLSVDRGLHEFFPPSPLREPWPSLFASAPDEALRLLRELSNHAINAWRQLHRHVHDRKGTPIPLVLEFPWGTQTFWGNGHEYLWSRGIWGPKPIASGYMALERWCFEQLDGGRSVDELLQQILPGNDCVAILGTAAAIALHAQHLSEITFAIATSQRLWHLDHDRFTQDISGASGSLIGFMRKEDLPHVEAIKTANARPIRQNQLQWLARNFVLNQEFSEKAQAAISRFPDDLPYEYEEHRNAPNAGQYYSEKAKVFAEVADIKNYRLYKTDKEGELAIIHESPSAQSPAELEKVESAKIQVNDIGLLMWAQKSLDNGALEPSRKLSEAVGLARQLDEPTLFDTSAHGDLHMRRGGVAATAAVAVQYAQELNAEELTWARATLLRASKTPEHRDGMWISSASALFHPCIFAAAGLAHQLRTTSTDTEAAKCLLELVAHPLEEVSLSAVGAAAKLWQSNSKLVWTAFYLAFRLCLLQPRPPERPRGPSEPNNDAAYVDESLAAATAYYLGGDGWLPLPALPPAWIKLDGKRRARSRRPRFVIGEDDIVPDETEEQWGEPPVFWHSQLAAKVIRKLPLVDILASDARAPLLGYLSAMFDWTLEKNEPSWDKDDRGDHDTTRHYEWTRAFANLLGQLWGILDFDEAKASFIDRILQLKGDARWAMLSSGLSTFLAVHVYDAPTIAPRTMDVVQLCLDRFLQAPSFKRDSYSAGKFDRSDEPSLVSSFLFVEFDNAPRAARFTNGDWSELNLILPIVRRIVTAGGWSVYLMSRFLTLCDRAEAAFPSAEFAQLVFGILKDGPATLPGWHGTMLPAKIASLIQRFADRDMPLPLEIAQQFLRILDLLVDMGDRRSAALQLSETFRDIRLDST